jgi:hypothetical protein
MKSNGASLMKSKDVRRLTTQEEFALVKAIIALLDPATEWKNSDKKTHFTRFGNYKVYHSRFDKHFDLERTNSNTVPWAPYMRATITELIVIYDDKKYSKTRYKIGFEPMKLLYQELTSLYQRHFDKLLALTRKYCLEWTLFQRNPRPKYNRYSKGLRGLGMYTISLTIDRAYSLSSVLSKTNTTRSNFVSLLMIENPLGTSFNVVRHITYLFDFVSKRFSSVSSFLTISSVKGPSRCEI